AKLGELLSLAADDCGLVSPKAEGLGLGEVGRAAELAEEAPRLVLGVVQEALQALHAVLVGLLDGAQPLLERLDLLGGVEQVPGWIQSGQPRVDLDDRGASRRDGRLGQAELVLGRA